MSGRSRLSWGERLVLAAPYLYLTVFFLAPFVLIVKISLSRQTLAIPPYEPVFDWGQGPAEWLEKVGGLGFDAWRALAADSLYVEAIGWSLAIAALLELIAQTPDVKDGLQLRGNPPVGTCTICVGKKDIGWQAHFGVVRALENQTFYRGE